MSRRVLEPYLGGLVRVSQPESGYRFSVDAPLLAAFTLESTGFGGPFVELGAGCGVVSALVALASGACGTGLELQDDHVAAARETVAANGLQGRVDVVLGDLRDLRGRFDAGCAATVFSNPPYHPLGQGRMSRDESVALSRHEVACSMVDVLSAMRYLLGPGGRGSLVYPVPRLPGLLGGLAAHKLYPVRLRMVHADCHQEASLVLLEVAKSSLRSGFRVESPWNLEGESSQWYEGLRSRVATRVESRIPK